jgi:hypothetical protein
VTKEVLRVVEEIKEESDLKELKRLLEKYALPITHCIGATNYVAWYIPGEKNGR